MAIGDIYRTTLYYSDGAGLRSQNVLHHKVTTDPSSSDPFQVAAGVVTQIQTHWQTPLLGIFATDFTVRGYGSKRINNGGGPTAVQQVNMMGSVEGQGGPNGVCSNVQLFPADTPYQRKTGHIYFPAIPQGFMVDDGFTNDYATAITTLMGLIELPLLVDTGSLELVVYDRTTDTGIELGDWQLAAGIYTKVRRQKPRFYEG